MRINKTNKNLQKIWDQLDSACGDLENAFSTIVNISGIPKEIKDKVEKIDFSAIVALKNEIEELIN